VGAASSREKSGRSGFSVKGDNKPRHPEFTQPAIGRRDPSHRYPERQIISFSARARKSPCFVHQGEDQFFPTAPENDPFNICNQNQPAMMRILAFPS